MELMEFAHEYMATIDDLRRQDWGAILEGISQREFAFLMTILKHKLDHPGIRGIYASDLAKRVHLTKSGVSKMLAILEERGWVERTVDQNSRRNTFVSLTPAGEQICRVQRDRWDN